MRFVCVFPDHEFIWFHFGIEWVKHLEVDDPTTPWCFLVTIGPIAVGVEGA